MAQSILSSNSDIAYVKVAHLSDLHLSSKVSQPGPSGGSETIFETITRCGNFFRGQHAENMRSYSRPHWDGLQDAMRGYDAYVISGDVATTGHESDVSVAYNMLRGNYPKYLSLRKIGLGFPANRLVVMPGNHDRYYGKKCEPLSQEFERQIYFTSKWDLLNSKNSQNGRSALNTYKISCGNGVGLGVVAIDFSYDQKHLTSLRRMVHRRLGGGIAEPDLLKRAINATYEIRKRSIPVIWVMHFPPVGVWDPSLYLENSRLVMEAAGLAKIRLILSGHTHKCRIVRKAQKDKKEKTLSEIIIATAGTPTEMYAKECSFLELTIGIQGTTAELVDQKMMLAQTQPKRPGEDFSRVKFMPQKIEIEERSYISWISRLKAST